jgi:signal transduction histidine kinase
MLRGMAHHEPDFRTLFEHSPDVLLVLLPDAPRFTMVAATEARFAATHTTRDTLGRGLFEIFPDNPEDPEASGTSNLRASLERVIATRAPDTMAVQKYDIRAPDGSFETKYWSPKNLPVLSPQGEVRYIIHRVEEVTELVRASELGEELRDRTQAMEREVVRRSMELAETNRELRAANAKLGELDAAKTAFFSNVSHEFRTPLTLMLGPLEDLLAHGTLTGEQRERVQLAHDHALRLLKLVNALLDFSRIEAGRLNAAYAPLDLATFTAELAGMFQSAGEKAGVRLVIDCPAMSEPAFVDRDMWEKIVPNLLSNALKFTFEGEIAVRLREEPARFALEVTDTGVGIPPEELPRIFERFHRVAGARGRTHEGTGIGLSLVQQLVELHGGRVSVASEVGRGSTFRVEIPKGTAHLPPEAVSNTPADPRVGRDAAALALEARRWSASSSTEARPAAVASVAARTSVLVVDDNADLRGYIAGLLAPFYDVTVAADGMAALDTMRERVPDIVVSDVMMPRLDGVGLVRELRARSTTSLVPVILLSARAGEEAAIEGLDAGCDDYLVKPFSARELLARVRTHVELARTRRAWILELERANRELDAFSYSVSHDLRAPLRAIDGFSLALVREFESLLDERGRDYVSRVRRNVARMGELIDALLELARIARSSVSSDEVDLSLLAAEVVADLSRQQPERKVDVAIAAGLDARGDRRLLRVVLVNLLSNAWKFTGRSEAPRIEVGALPAEEPTFYVRDNGAGFDMSYAQRLFAPFQRLHDPREFEGTGIGLATSQRAIARHHGRIWAESAPGRGATFFFSLPEPPTRPLLSHAPGAS